MEHTDSTQNYFEKPRGIWFPDFEEVIKEKELHYRKCSAPFTSLLIILRYFRREISQAEFVERFLAQQAPEKMLSAHRRLYTHAKQLCDSCQRQEICKADFDEQMILCFRDRPAGNVFMPDFELWQEITALISKLEQKMHRLPFHFDGIGWNAYLIGRVTRDDYAERYLAWGTGDHLAHMVAYGTNKEEFAEKYRVEISVCRNLRRLCIEYKQKMHSSSEFDAQFLNLAKEFCADIKDGGNKTK